MTGHHASAGDGPYLYRASGPGSAQRRIGYPAVERSFARLLVGALLAVLVLLLVMVGGISLLIYFASGVLDTLAPQPIRTPGM